MLRRNVASQVVYLPALQLTADGTAVTTGASLTVAKDGTEASASGTLTHSAEGVWKYTPTQSETDCAILSLILTATAANPVVLNLVTTGADTSAPAFGANTTAPDNAGISAAAADAAAAKTAAQSADGKLTSGRTSRIDRLPDVNAGSAGGLSLVGSEMTLDSATLAALFSDTDTAALVDAIIARVEDDLDGSDLSVAAIAVAVRDAVLDRLLSGNHDTAGSVGAFLQQLDAAVSSRLASGSYTAPDNAGIYAAAAAAATAASQATTAATQATTAATQATTAATHATTAATQATTAATESTAAATNTATLMNRVTTGAAQLFTDLIAMLTGSGTPDPQWTADALALGPSGGGGAGGLTEDQQAQLSRIEGATARLRGSPVQVTANVGDGGRLRLTLGDDHETIVANALPIVVSDPGGLLHARLTATGTTLQWKAGQNTEAALLAGSVASVAYDNDSQETTITVEVPNCAAAGNTLAPYTWQLQRTIGGRRIRELRGTLTLEQDMIGS